MAVVIDGTTGISTPAETVLGNLSYTGTLTGNGGIVNLGSGQVYKDASGNVGIGTSSPSARLSVNQTGIAVNIGDISSAPSSNVNTFIGPATSTLAGVNGDLVLCPRTSTTASILFYTGNGTSAERARITSSGQLQLGSTNTNNSNVFSVQGTVNGNVCGVRVHTNGNAAWSFLNSSGLEQGYIQVNASSVSYVTASDYRLKHEIQAMTGALAKVAALNPVTYKWKSNGEVTQGFIAHELQAVVPECVTGEKDAVDADGNPQYQGIDTSFLVATLAAAIQELKAIVDAQAARITALEGTAA